MIITMRGLLVLAVHLDLNDYANLVHGMQEKERVEILKKSVKEKVSRIMKGRIRNTR